MSYAGTIIIVTFNSRAIVKDCLDSIARNSREKLYKTIVVDNCSNDGSQEFIKEHYPWVKLIASKKNRGFGAGNNLGVKQAEGDWVFILNPDTVVIDSAIEILSQFLKSNPNVGCVGPGILNQKYEQTVSYYAFNKLFMSMYHAVGLSKIIPVNRIDGKWTVGARQVDRPIEVDRILGAAMMIPIEVINQTGGFDERFFLFSEEEDLCYRIISEGYKVIYNPEAKVMHEGGDAVKNVFPLAVAAANWSKFLFIEKHFGKIKAHISRFGWLKMILLRYFIYRLTHRKPDPLKIKGYIYSIKSLLFIGYFDEKIKPD